MLKELAIIVLILIFIGLDTNLWKTMSGEGVWATIVKTIVMIFFIIPEIWLLVLIWMVY